MDAEIGFKAEEMETENGISAVSEMADLGVKLMEALQEIVEKENELLKRLDQLIRQFESQPETSPESETAGQKHSVFITEKR